MTHTEQFIKDAIAGGWEGNKFQERLYVYGDSLGRTYSKSEPLSSVLLDPLAWLAVGKTRGWDVQVTDELHRYVQYVDCPEVTYNMHRFIDHLCDGDSIEDALGKIS